MFERDEWTCRECFVSEGKEELSLQAHHTYYVRDTDPWEYPLESIITLCANCHDEETHTRSQADQDLLRVLREKGLLASDLRWLTQSFRSGTFVESPSFLVFSFGWILAHPELQRLVIDLVKEKL